MKKSTKNETVTVKFPRLSGKDEAVFVSVGERSWRVKRGCEVEIPLCAYDVLCNSEAAEDRAVAYIDGRR